MDDVTVRELMAGLADETPVRGEVNSYRAAETANRLRRRRHRTVLSSAAALVVFVLVAVAIVVAAGHHRPRPVVNQPSPPPEVVVAPARFDPAKTWLTPGWLPSGLGLSSRHLDRDNETISYGGSGDPVQITIQLSRRDGPAPVNGKSSVGPRINGAASEWSAYPYYSAGKKPQTGTILSWEWAPGAIASVSVLGVAAPRAVAFRIATTVRTQEKRLALPFRFTPPSTVPLSQTVIEQTKPGYYQIKMVYLSVPGRGPGVLLTVHPLGNGGVNATEQAGPWDVEVDSGNYGFGTVTFVDEEHDALVDLQGRPEHQGPTADPTPGINLARQVAASFVLVGDPLTPSTWQ